MSTTVPVRFLHTSDWQLGMTRHFLTGEAQARFGEARIDAIATMARIVDEHACAFVVVAGDVFETNQPDARTLTRALDRLRAFDVPVYLLPGNHDPDDASSIYRDPTFTRYCPDHVEVLTDMQPRTPVDGIEVVGGPWRSKAPARDLVADACEVPATSGRLRVVVGHGSMPDVSGAFAQPGAIDLARVTKAIDAGHVDYVALGDRHSVTNVGATGRVWFSGAPEPTNYRERDAGAALVVRLKPHEIDVKRVQVGTWQFHHIDHAVDHGADLDRLEAALDAIDDASRAIVKISLTGTLDLRQAARLDAMLERRSALFGALEHPARHRDVVVRASETDLDDLPLTGYAAVARDRLQATVAAGGDGAAVATDALGLLLRLAGDTASASDHDRAGARADQESAR